MLLSIERNWWVLLLRGIFAILFGVMAFAWPGITLWALVILYGVYALLDGITAVGLGFAAHGEAQGAGRAWWEMVLVGALGIAAGIVTFVWPGVTATALLIIIAAWAIVRGIAEIVAAIRLRKMIEHEWMLGFAGLLSVAFGVILLARPVAGALAMVWVIGAWAILFGIVAIVLSLKLRARKNRREGGGARPAVGLA
jgi:uncharacterized membrane protein HdeD (DUF308 family)